jgi:tetratricopeptide (TPR) repeat protein
MYLALRRYIEAEASLLEAESASAEALQPNDPQHLAVLNDLATLYLDTQRHPNAQATLDALLKLAKDGPDRWAALNSLARLYSATGQSAAAEEAYRSALEGNRTTLGANHPNTLAILNELANFYSTQGRSQEAEALFQQALGDNKLGPRDLNRIASAVGLGQALVAEGQTKDAEPLFRSALEAGLDMLGPENPLMLISFNSLVTLYNAEGRRDQANELAKLFRARADSDARPFDSCVRGLAA